MEPWAIPSASGRRGGTREGEGDEAASQAGGEWRQQVTSLPEEESEAA